MLIQPHFHVNFIDFYPLFLRGWFLSTHPVTCDPMVGLILQAGSRYFLRARHNEGWGSDWVRVGVRVFSPRVLSWTERRFSTVTEKQKISILSTIQREIQELTFTSTHFLYIIAIIS